MFDLCDVFDFFDLFDLFDLLDLSDLLMDKNMFPAFRPRSRIAIGI